MKHRLTILAALALAVFAAAPVVRADDAEPAVHVRGTITKTEPGTLTVKTMTGTVSVAINGQTKVVGVVPTTVDEVTSGTFIGTANVPDSATSMRARALEVVVFPQSMAGTGEGDYPWDLPAGKAHSSMTNGTVAAHHGSMMTNATVMGVNNGASKVVTLQYKGGTKAVTIPPGTPIVRIVPGSQKLLVAGAHIVAFPAKSAGGPAPFVIVGEEGAVPPM